MTDPTQLRLIADDLTGALDSAAAFVGLFPALRVGNLTSAEGSLVLNSASREATSEQARQAVSILADALAPASGRLSFFKVDSLLRGHAAAELDALLSKVRFDRVIIAPAVPAQNRVTRKGRQHALVGGHWTPTGEDLLAELQRQGHRIRINTPEAKQTLEGDGLVWCDAADDDTLDQIVDQVSPLPGSVLWVGAAGLAAALARRIGRAGSGARSSPVPFQAPLLGLIGSHHAVMQKQLSAVSALHVPSHRPAEIIERMTTTDAVMVTCDLPEGSTHENARHAIAKSFSALIPHIPVPASLFVSGGETLQSLLTPLQARSLVLLGEFEAGIPVSRIEGGIWHGVNVISKSGAFGSADLLLRLISSLNPHPKAIVA